jgi:hypothetical protein
MAATDTRATAEELLEAVFSVWSEPRLYNEGQPLLWKSSEMAVRRAGRNSEISDNQRGREAVNTEVEESTTLEAVIR